MEFIELNKSLQASMEHAEKITIENMQENMGFSPYIYFGDK